MFPSLSDISDSIDDLFSSDSLKKGLKAAGKGVVEGMQSDKNSVSSSTALLNALERNTSGGGNFAAEVKKAQQMQSVDPHSLEAYWQDRLATFAKIQRETGTSLK